MKLIYLLFTFLFSAPVLAGLYQCPTPSAVASIGLQFDYYDKQALTWYFKKESSFGTRYWWHFTFLVGGTNLQDAKNNAKKYLQTMYLISENQFPNFYSCTYNTTERQSAANAVTKF